MKTRICLLFGMLLLSTVLICQKSLKSNEGVPEGSFDVYCSSDMIKLATAWAEEFMKTSADVRIEVKELDPEKEALYADGSILFTEDSENVTGSGDMPWKIAVGRDIIVPVINAKNPALDELRTKGITSDQMLKIVKDPGHQNWATITAKEGGHPVHFYLSNDDQVIEGLKNFVGVETLELEGFILTNESDVVSKMQSDAYALGFCRLTSVVQSENQQLAENILLLPIDRNKNGKLDYIESIYDDLNVFSRGVWIGKYPKSLYSDLYFISERQPTEPAQTAFLNWVMTSGQPFLSLNGFSGLTFSERQSKVDKINNVIATTPLVEKVNPIPKLVFLVSLAILFSGLIIGTVLRFGRKKSEQLPEKRGKGSTVFDENSLSVPKGLYFDKSHTWAFMEKDGLVRVGIDDFLQHVTGRITRVDFKKPGEKIKRGDTLVTIAHKGKHLNIYSPVSGVVKDCNRLLANHGELINESPYAEGWIYMVEPVRWTQEIRVLSLADNYIKWLNEEFARLKDFLAMNLNADRVQYARIILQDGGMLKSDVLEDLDPEVWEDFQTEFLDTYK